MPISKKIRPAATVKKSSRSRVGNPHKKHSAAASGHSHSEKKKAAIVPQGETSKTNTIDRWLGGDDLVANPIVSDYDVLYSSAQGIAKASVDQLANHLGISRKSMAEDILDLSVKTLERKAPTDKLDKKTSSHALEIAKTLQHAFEVFEDAEKVKQWINKENRALNGMKPVAFFDTLTGLNMVHDVLGRIEEGVYS